MKSVLDCVRCRSVTAKNAFSCVAAAIFVLGVTSSLRAQIARAYGGEEIPVLPGGRASYGTAINAAGHVVGASGTTNGKDHAFRYRPGPTTDLGALGSISQAPFTESVANGINATGVVVGQSSAMIAVVVRDGIMSALPKFHIEAFPQSSAYGINSAGDIVGEATSVTVRQFVGGVNNGPLHAFLFRAGAMTDLGTLGGVAGKSTAYAINDRGQVVGQSDTFGGNGFDHAFLYENGAMRDLGTLPGYEESCATAINASGVVVGHATSTRLLTSSPRRGFIYSNGAMRDLGTLSGGSNAAALGINDAGVVVGWASNRQGQPVAMVYTLDRGIIDLNSLLTLGIFADPTLNADLQRLTAAVAINNSGQIVCQGQYSNGTTRAILLNPGQAEAVIAAHPTSQAVAPGAAVTFSVTATGDALSYQWFKDGTPISGATAASIALAAARTSDAGSYTVMVRNLISSVTSRAAVLTVGLVPVPSRLVNLSIRSSAGSGDNTLIVGIVIGGAGANGTKPILARGIGPALGEFGVTGFLTDPVMAIFSGSTKISENDNWGGLPAVVSASTQVGAFALSGSTTRDAAIYDTAMAPGSYSIQISGVGTASGAVLAEVYDATPAGSFSAFTTRLVNASARTQVGTGDNILIAGFAISGDTAKSVLVRAVGPTLTQFGVGGTLSDPQLKLFDSSGRQIAENDDWGGTTTLSGAFGSVGAFSLSAGSKDAALVASLSPGSYTAQVSGAAGGTGVALVEVYEIP